MEQKMRLDKFLANYTDLSRKDAKKMIRGGAVVVDGELVKEETFKVSVQQDIVLRGTPVLAEEFIYYMLNKPSGVVSASKDAAEKTVIDLIDETVHTLFPIGRLDKDTEGLLILTDDGMLAHQLLSPRYHVQKTYYVEYDGMLNEDYIYDFQEGIDIGEKKKTRPADIVPIAKGKANLTITEGKFHQVKRMIAKEGGHVTYLKRIRMGEIWLDNSLSPGEFRKLTDEEIRKLKDIVYPDA